MTIKTHPLVLASLMSELHCNAVVNFYNSKGEDVLENITNAEEYYNIKGHIDKLLLLERRVGSYQTATAILKPIPVF